MEAETQGGERRLAGAMIRKGTAPAVDYVITPSDNGRFEIVWKIAKTAPTSYEVENEIVKASANAGCGKAKPDQADHLAL